MDNGGMLIYVLSFLLQEHQQKKGNRKISETWLQPLKSSREGGGEVTCFLTYLYQHKMMQDLSFGTTAIDADLTASVWPSPRASEISVARCHLEIYNHYLRSLAKCLLKKR